jgi:hypothetical protein
VRSLDDVDRVRSKIADLACWSKRSALLAPRATIVTVKKDTLVKDLWRTLVAELVQHVNVVLVDISTSTENLQWELALLKQKSFQQTVFIANRESESAISPPAGFACIFYENSFNGSAQKAFLCALMRALDTCAKGPPAFDYREWLLRPLATCLRTLVVIAVAMIFIAHLLLVILGYMSGG